MSRHYGGPMIGATSWDDPPPADPGWTALLDAARAAAGDPDAALGLVERAAELLPRPSGGRTAELWRGMAELAAIDLTVARALEPHLDAVTILAQARDEGFAVPASPVSGTWGVFAAEGPGTRLESHPTGPSDRAAADTGDGDSLGDEPRTVLLTGRKPGARWPTVSTTPSSPRGPATTAGSWWRSTWTTPASSSSTSRGWRGG